MRQFIKNRKNQNICVMIEWASNNKWLAFVMHGLSGTKDEKHIRTFIQSFLDNNFTVISFDTTNTFWESDGKYEDATVTNYYEDLYDVIQWSEQQNFYQEKFFLVWHSLWGICISLYAQNFPERIIGLAPISTVVSWKLSIELWNRDINKWKKEGFVIEKSDTSPEWFKKLKYSHIVDRLKYDLLENTKWLQMPVLMIVWDKDTSTPLKHQKIFFEKLETEKELHIIKWWSHTFKEQKHLDEIYKIFNDWINRTI